MCRVKFTLRRYYPCLKDSDYSYACTPSLYADVSVHLNTKFNISTYSSEYGSFESYTIN